MIYDNIVDKKESVGIITFDRPPENRLTVPLIQELEAAVQHSMRTRCAVNN
jgi:enoyl-CoA hydratase/carnithine racemase